MMPRRMDNVQTTVKPATGGPATKGGGRGCVYLALGGVAVAAIVGAVPGLDLKVANWFFDPKAIKPWAGGWEQPWQWLYEYGYTPGWVLAIGAAAALVYSLVRRTWISRRAVLVVIVLATALGPGLLVNGVLKPNWGRPRPAQLEVFGGTESFRGWWQPGGRGAGGSFASGHVSMTAVLISGVLLIPKGRRKTRLAVAAGCVTLTGMVAYARMAQGGHFLSDVLFAVTLTYLVIAGLRRWVKG
ncbi:MAG: phosphatase PAP2 family protein [Phycisphaeraceae bacterium]|nr:phosphatase PAP2 family protein [Phycisphaeraceae bacterium]